MSVDTSSADDPTVGRLGAGIGQALAGALPAGEAVLARRFGSSVKLVDPEDLAGTGPATVVRAKVASASFALPRTLVIKHYPPAPADGNPFAQEAVSYQLFTALPAEDRMCPELLAHDGAKRLLVLEDLGRAPTLRDKLHGGDARAAERALLSWARSLGRLHAVTAEREDDINALLRRLGGRMRADVPCPLDPLLPGMLVEMFGIGTPPGVQARALRAAELGRSPAYRAFSPVDLSPENNLVTGSGVRFLDFELGRMRNAMVDAAHLRLPFAARPDACALPAGMSEAMVAAWRAEVSCVWPGLAEDGVLGEHLLDGQLRLVWQATADALTGTPVRAAGPVTWWRDLARHALRAGDTELATHAEHVAGAFDERFGPGLELPQYPAFRP